MSPAPASFAEPTVYQRWQRFSAAAVLAFHGYANWLVGISWRKFVLLSVALIVGANILQDLPPFTWRVSEMVETVEPAAPPREPKAPKPPKAAKSADKPIKYEVTIDERGVRIHPADAAASGAASAASAASNSELPSISIDLPKNARTEEIRQAINEARDAVEAAARDAAESARQADADAREAKAAARTPGRRTTVIRLGDFLVNLAVFIVLSSAVIKAMYKGRMVAEVKAAQATETAEAESLKRQVVEARMAAMQAQVEPHFLFNTLASIDHLIETDPPRASQMQKNLIALLRASMPTMREANATASRDLGRELSVIRPYLEILKVRMEERLQTEIDVPEGLMSAEFPSMMIQSLVENAIKHGLEPKAEGGKLTVKAEILHGKLAVTVADTGLGFGRAATGGTGVGLANIRERLMLLHGAKAAVTVSENQPSGTKVTITVPYVSRVHPQTEGASA
jgi:signal transduction histidine kinase